ncbi:MAG: SDR family NAD(P)-dependent oxidoreductase [Luminiphilus sp.]|nr:SDR family NAD(P)-dependent oxidoreductase [Luminiphilus sp.]
MKTAFVTGAAQGIGLAIARRFAQAGYRVGLFDINDARCHELLGESEFTHAIAGHCDVRDKASVDAALAYFSEATAGRLDVLVNNAGVLTAGEPLRGTNSCDGRCQCDGCDTGLLRGLPTP